MQIAEKILRFIPKNEILKILTKRDWERLTRVELTVQKGKLEVTIP